MKWNGWTRKFAWFPFHFQNRIVWWEFYWARVNEGGGDTITFEEYPK